LLCEVFPDMLTPPQQAGNSLEKATKMEISQRLQNLKPQQNWAQSQYLK